MSAGDLTHASAFELASLIRTKQVSPVEVIGHFLDRISIHDQEIGAFITVIAEQAMTEAHRAESAVLAEDPLGPLHGVPVGVKDLEATKGIRTTYGSLVMSDYVPEYDDISVERLRAAGSIIVGKTNTPEYGWKATSENLLVGATRNPWDLSKTSGGSSGGSAAAVAARLVPIASGSDAGGSIRIPASFCGVYGIKPTQGRVASSLRRNGGWRPLSQHGPITNSVLDAAVLLNVLSGPDGRDPRSIQEVHPDFTSAIENPSVNGMRIAWSPDLDQRPLDPEVATLTTAAANKFEALGARVDEVKLRVNSEEASWILATLLLTETAISLGPILEQQDHRELPSTLVDWLSDAIHWPATRYARAMREIAWHNQAFAEIFGDYDLLLTPTVATAAFPLERNPELIAGRKVDPWWGFTPFCMHANLTGQPAASLPCGLTSGRTPVGIQIVGKIGDELSVLQASAAYEKAHPWQSNEPARYNN